MKKRLLSLTALALAGIMTLSGCGSKTNENNGQTGNTDNQTNNEQQQKEEVKVDIFQFKVEAKDALESAADAYMAEYPNVKIEIQTVGGGDDYGAALRSKFASGEEPAIYNVGGLQDVNDWMEKLEDLSNQPWVSQAYDGVLDAVTVDGKIYGLPFNQEGYGLIYNKGLFEKAGIDASTITTFDALEAAVKDLDSKKEELGLEAVIALPAKETWVTGLHLSNVAFANEFGSVVNAYNAKETEFKYADGLKALLDLQADYGYQPDGSKKSLNSVDYSTQVEEMFSLEQVAIIQQGNWALGSIQGIDEEVAKNIGFLPIPLKGVKEDSIAVGVPMYWSVNSEKDEAIKTEAKAFLNWLYTSEKGKEMIIHDFKFIPALKGYDSDNLKPADPLAQDILTYSNEGKTMPWVFMGYPTAWGMDVLGANIQSYLADEMTWEELVQNSKEQWAQSRAEGK